MKIEPVRIKFWKEEPKGEKKKTKKETIKLELLDISPEKAAAAYQAFFGKEEV